MLRVKQRNNLWGNEELLEKYIKSSITFDLFFPLCIFLIPYKNHKSSYVTHLSFTEYNPASSTTSLNLFFYGQCLF